MPRRKLVAVAGACVMTAFAATAAFGANLGLFGLTQPDARVGNLDRVRAASTIASDAASTTTPSDHPLADD